MSTPDPLPTSIPAQPKATPTALAIELPSPIPYAVATPGPDAKRYWGKGVVTKLDPANPSIELDHEPIPTAMPQAMRMEFFVIDRKLLDGLAVGDSVDFELLVEGSRERISDLKKR